jgi:hypothetical protein
MKTRGGLLVLASIAGLLSSATAQPPPPPARNPDNLNNPQNLNNPIYQSNPQDLGPSAGPPLYGAPRPDTRPDPNPRLRIKRPTDCPYGYRQGGESRLQMPHLVICVVKQPYEPEYVDTPIGVPLGVSGGGQQTTPTALERTIANQCLGHPTGSYACGRGATECCSPTQDNMCFAGSYACYATSARDGPKKACCMSK